MRAHRLIPIVTLCLTLGVSLSAIAKERVIRRAKIRSLVEPQIEAALAPCEIVRIRVPRKLKMHSRKPSVRVEVKRPRRSGSLHAIAVFESPEGNEIRVPISLRVSCPGAVIKPGQSVQAVSIFGNVRASMTAEARQLGRVGDVIRLQSSKRTSLRGRIVDARTVEVLH